MVSYYDAVLNLVCQYVQVHTLHHFTITPVLQFSAEMFTTQ